jgi:hypothetical protein
MDIYRINTMGNVQDRELCLLEGAPEGTEERSYCMTLGEPATPWWPGTPTISLREENPGMKLSSLLGNTDRFLLCSTELKDHLARACEGLEIEYLPFVLLDHRGRVHSRDHWFVNPIGAYTILVEGNDNPDRERLWLVDPAKVAAVPPLFRLDVDHTVVLVRGDLAESLMAASFTNVRLKKLAVKA